ncbi:TlpA family protein disulfide reductase [Sphingomicrobium lutaoense]|uniref:Thiol-disulfide isomerase/thioredoxin n=1 Tax=Sphingomicrobium lutaoense TaxID=515949 RepID=A0A839Z492_9SPHN|nr:TlpA disulfide reductase family protein [Sphingomicrobium lutaoense]MBB3764663.1 thiol-disulfide isomerase/thioredoxin [Sphingomicrobium lutaoense]
MKALPVISLALMLAACGQQPSSPTKKAEAGECRPPEAGGVDRCHVGKEMPDIAVLAPDGGETTLADIAAGEPLLVNLWASWCAPCVKELPTLLALSGREDAPRVLTLNQDMGPQRSVQAFLEGHGVGDLGAWQDPDMAMTDALPVTIMPTTVLYDGEGREVWRYVGDLDWNGEEASRLLAELG